MSKLVLVIEEGPAKTFVSAGSALPLLSGLLLFVGPARHLWYQINRFLSVEERSTNVEVRIDLWSAPV
jgi:hypothetical protein